MHIYYVLVCRGSNVDNCTCYLYDLEIGHHLCHPRGMRPPTLSITTYLYKPHITTYIPRPMVNNQLMPIPRRIALSVTPVHSFIIALEAYDVHNPAGLGTI